MRLPVTRSRIRPLAEVLVRLWTVAGEASRNTFRYPTGQSPTTALGLIRKR
jgi:hypothetical protein